MEILQGWAFYFLSLIFLMMVGHYLITKIIFQSFEIKRQKAVLLFILVFGLSNLVLEMFIIEILKIGSEE